MLELLAPAGSMEALTAAVQNGANAVYLGFGDFNARRSAANFTEDSFAAAVRYCHLRGVKVYLTLNTLLTDRELPVAAMLAARAWEMGADAVLVQDLGLLQAIRQTASGLPVHASTQMTVCNLDGVKMCADLGMTRAVLSRELSVKEIGFICEHAPIEIEVFGHGALCVCYSGQCFFSAVVGERSGNRGMCAQPCRMPYGLKNRPDSFPLSLKDVCLADRLGELEQLGVTCLKLEGRMKRPEYVAVVTRIYSTLLEEQRAPSRQEWKDLETAFSRNGFTQGYFDGRTGPEMFGVRDVRAAEPAELFAKARRTYTTQERACVDVTCFGLVKRGEPVRVKVQDEDGNQYTAVGEPPEEAVNWGLTEETVARQLSRTGGTPFRCQRVRAVVEPGLQTPLRALNTLRRKALDGLSEIRQTPLPVCIKPFVSEIRYENSKEPPVLLVSVRHAVQVSSDLLRLAPRRLDIPCQELAEHPECLKGISRETEVCVLLPRVVWDGERSKILQQLEVCRKFGDHALIGNYGVMEAARTFDFALRGDFGIPVFNAQTLEELKNLGFQSATASFELKFAQIRDLSKTIPLEAIVYGRLPLMITENEIPSLCKRRSTVRGEEITLIDRKGERFPVIPALGGRNEILNSQVLFLADKSEWKRVGLYGGRLFFTTERPDICIQVMERYLEKNMWRPEQLTRGLYYRGVK